MVGKIALVMVLVLGLGWVSSDSLAASLAYGKRAPKFVVKSGDDRKLTLDMILGKVVVFFYETKEMVDLNDELKEELKHLYQIQPEDIQKEIFRLVVIDCSQASVPTLYFWKSKLMEKSQKQGFTIYGDWDRKMLADYGMQENDSNFLIIDKQGIVRYSATGKINNGQFPKIKDLLTSLVQ